MKTRITFAFVSFFSSRNHIFHVRFALETIQLAKMHFSEKVTAKLGHLATYDSRSTVKYDDLMCNSFKSNQIYSKGLNGTIVRKLGIFSSSGWIR